LTIRYLIFITTKTLRERMRDERGTGALGRWSVGEMEL